MRKALITAAGGLALALALSACGGVGDGKYQDADSLVRAATASTEKVKSTAFTLTMKVGPLGMTGEGASSYDSSDPRTQMTMSIDVGALGGGAEPMEMEARQIGEDLYLKLPTNLPGGMVDENKPWHKTSVAEQVPGSTLDVDRYLQSTDPSKMIEMLKESGELVDTETGVSVNNRSATKYSFEVDFQKVLENYGGNLESMPGMSQFDLDAIPVDIYLDEQDLPARLYIDFREVVEQAIEQAGGEGNLPDGVSFDEAYMQMDFTDWGNEVQVEAPPADEISDQPIPGMGGGAPNPDGVRQHTEPRVATISSPWKPDRCSGTSNAQTRANT